MDTEHKADERSYCDNPDCRACNAWRAFWADAREQSRQRYKCTNCGELPPADMSPLYALAGRVVCQACYQAGTAPNGAPLIVK